MTNILEKPLTRFRGNPSRGGSPKVDREGGDYGAGMIVGMSVITRGEALGHRMWIDQFAVDQVVKMGNKARGGVKSRFAHPGLSSDGMGTLLGRIRNFRGEGDRAVADLHFEQSSHNTPDGDLASYVMDLAEEDPEAFGTSIVFEHDYGAEDRFLADNEDEGGNFQSPDNDNKKHYRHARLARLLADDIVDSPAANPGGLFREGHEIADEADKLCEFALGLTSDRPELKHLSADADRIASFAARFLESHNLELKQKEPVMNEQEKIAAAVKESSDKLSADHKAAIAKLQADHEAEIAKLKAPPKTDPPADDPKLAERKRVHDLHSLAANAGIKDQATINRWVDGNLSVLEAKAEIAETVIKQGKLSKDDPPAPADNSTKAKSLATEEYRQNAKLHASLGFAEDKWVEGRAKEIEAELAAAK
ncbi:MAG: hypothetical protein AB7G28_20695 [Pirellulales bacterium]